jgi:excinuclease ABC subunit C
VEVYIGLSDKDITVTHDPSVDGRHQWFGPYLGGLRVRTAVSALERLLPIGRPGTGRALALARGTAVLDPEQVLTTWTTVLRRDPSAVAGVRDRLIQRRTRLSEELRFELAAAAHAELGAVDWVLAEQKAALLEPVDAVICGWAGGLSIRFDMRAGRIVQWTQRACDEPSGSRLVERTPPGWRAFAARAAELAVVLKPGVDPAFRRPPGTQWSTGRPKRRCSRV